jgi:putative membrane protein
VTDDEGWQRLDARMLLIDPVKTLRQFVVPAVIALLGLRSSMGGWQVWLLPVFVVAPVLIGSIPWLTTRFRITDTQFQLHSGLLSKKQLTAPLDRIRSVDLEATVLHRVLGLSRVQIGTGVDDTRITLDSLSVPQARELRGVLLARRTATVAVGRPLGEAAAQDGAGGPPTPAAVEDVLARIDWSWLRFAPFSLSRLAVVAGAVGVLSQFVDEIPILDQDSLESGWEWVASFALPLVVLVALVGGLVGWVSISVAGYAVQWWDLLLVREPGHLRLTAGLFTTRSTTVEEARIRGVELTEPVLLRVVGGGELATLATGVGSGGVTKVLPPCPVGVAISVGRTLLDGDPALTAPLTPHGPAARRRCHVRAQWATLILTAVSLVPVVVLDLEVWLPALVLAVAGSLGVLGAEAAYAHLGHALTDRHLVAGSGVWQRTRTALERDGVIGWVVEQSYFQRRLGLATLVATTAAGAERVAVSDLPLGRAVALADAATPGLLTAFGAALGAEDERRPPA